MTTPQPLIALIEYTSHATTPQLQALLAKMRPGQVYQAAVLEVLGRLAAQSAPAAIYRSTAAPSGPLSTPPTPPGAPPTATGVTPTPTGLPSTATGALPLPTGTTPAPTLPPAAAQAAVSAAAEAQVGSVVRLRIGTTTLTAHSQQPLRVGQQLQVQVARTDPLVELRVLEPNTQVPARELLIQTALPRQQPTSELLQLLRELPIGRGDGATPRPAAGLPIPPAARAVIEQLATRPLLLEQVSAATVRTTLATSGILLDRALLAGQIPAPDVKLDLLRLLRLLQSNEPRQRVGGEAAAPTPADAAGRSPGDSQGLIDRLLRLLDGGLARVQLQQAASLPPEQGNRQTWQFELPLLAGNQVEEVAIRVERDGADGDTAGDGSGAAEWRVDLHFSFDRLGDIDASLRLNGETVSTLFWCERAATERLIGRRMPTLEAALRAAGLEIGRMAAMHGAPPEPIELPLPDRGLVDTHA